MPSQTPAVDLAAPIDNMWQVKLAEEAKEKKFVEEAAKKKSADAADASDLFASLEYAYLTPHLPAIQALVGSCTGNQEPGHTLCSLASKDLFGAHPSAA